MASKKWVSVCDRCGKGGKTASTGTGYQPSHDPQVGGKCPDSRDGNHKPRWREQR